MRIFLNVLLILTLLKVNAQDKYVVDFYKIDLISKENEVTELIRDLYSKEFYNNEEFSVYKFLTRDYLELIFFYKDGTFEKHLFKDDNHYLLRDFEYFDENLISITDSEIEQIKQLFKINRTETKSIKNNNCVKILFGQDDNIMAEIYASDKILNLPKHAPLPSNVYNGEPLEFIFYNLTEIPIHFGIVEFKEKVDLEKELNIDLENSKEINISKYENLKNSN